MRYLHTMLRVRDLDAALDFYCNKLGLKEVRRRVDDKNKYTLVFLAGPEDDGLVAKGPDGRAAPLVELTYNWNTEDYGEARYFGHLAYEVDDIYALCDRLLKAGVTINRPPRDGNMAFVRSPDKHSIELLAERFPVTAEGTVGVHAQCREMVSLSARKARPARLPAGFAAPPCRFRQSTLYVARLRVPDTSFEYLRASRAISALRLAVQDIALSRR